MTTRKVIGIVLGAMVTVGIGLFILSRIPMVRNYLGLNQPQPVRPQA